MLTDGSDKRSFIHFYIGKMRKCCVCAVLLQHVKHLDEKPSSFLQQMKLTKIFTSPFGSLWVSVSQFSLNVNAFLMALMNSNIVILSLYRVHLTKRFALTWPHFIVLIYFPLYMNVVRNVMCGKWFSFIHHEVRSIWKWIHKEHVNFLIGPQAHLNRFAATFRS